MKNTDLEIRVHRFVMPDANNRCRSELANGESQPFSPAFTVPEAEAPRSLPHEPALPPVVEVISSETFAIERCIQILENKKLDDAAQKLEISDFLRAYGEACRDS